MSAHFGKCNLDGRPVDSQEFENVRPMLARSGPDAEAFFCRDNLGIIYRAFHTVKECKLENQPYVSVSGNVVTWDGRLDNRETLIRQLEGEISTDSADVLIVAAAYEMWGTGAFANLKGDWALSIWDARKRGLMLAKDFAGTRHLYYAAEKDQITFSTVLDPLALFASRSLTIDEEYIAGWLSFFPAPHLTPYVGIHSVPPSSFVHLSTGMENITRYWDFDPGRKIRYRTDAEYEEHFRAEFGESVRRRLRSDRPVLAELSGGMDSSSIVCMADTLLRRCSAHTPRVDTISYYDDSEPNWNESPYFTKVEEKRGREGWHINARGQTTLIPEYDRKRFAATPASALKPSGMNLQFAGRLKSEGYRVVLSGFCGDEVLGGVPTPIPELADLLAQARVSELGKQIMRWALAKRTPVLHLFGETMRAFLPIGMVAVPQHKRPPAWLHPHFVKQNRAALSGYETRLKLFGPLPTFQENLATLEGLRRQLACSALPSDPPHEKRYPYLDRDLLEFIYAIPREQLLRPGQRRSLMRRALVGIVPDEILNRKRKAFVTRSPRVAISSEWDLLVQMTQHMISDSLQIVDSKLFCEALDKARYNADAQIVPLMRTIAVEVWLKSVTHWRHPCVAQSTTNDPETEDRPDDFALRFRQSVFSAENNSKTERR